MSTRKPRIALIGTGGSIATLGRHPLDLYHYAELGQTLQAGPFLALFAEHLTAFDIAEVPFANLVSSAIGPSDWLRLNEVVHQVAADPAVDGIVITHGTATLEETAYYLGLTLKVCCPVVIVGAQRPPNGLSSDAGLNLLNAFRVAAAPACRGLGVLVVMNDEIHAARDVTKTSNFRVQTFRTPELGCLGFADPDGIIAIHRRPTRRHTIETEFDTRGAAALPLVDIVYSYAGADGRAIDALVASGTQGIVVAGLPPGKATPAQRRSLATAAEAGVLVVQASRAGSGRIGQRTGAEAYVEADTLNPQKARVLAMLALHHGGDLAALQRMFHVY